MADHSANRDRGDDDVSSRVSMCTYMSADETEYRKQEQGRVRLRDDERMDG